MAALDKHGGRGNGRLKNGGIIFAVVGNDESTVVDQSRQWGERFFNGKIDDRVDPLAQYSTTVAEIGNVAQPDRGVRNSDHSMLRGITDQEWISAGL